MTISIEQVFIGAVGTILSAVMLWVGHSINRLNGTVAQLLERSSWQTETIHKHGDMHLEHKENFAQHNGRLSRLEGARG